MNSIETFNTFSEDLQKELDKRSKSSELVKTRSPFLRFTTGADMSQLEEKFGIEYRDYNGCKFFSVGLHGWNNAAYESSDLYNQRSDKGLVVGITYKQGSQKLVYTKKSNSETNRNYPPPGIQRAKIERSKSGNVLKFTVQFACYTQQQLELLDIAAFSPGMTCVLEWGNVESTRGGSLGIQEILDFSKINSDRSDEPTILDIIKSAKEQSRKSFVERWCKPNNFNYDFAVAHIANVSTVMENGVYNVSVVAYGVADNIMYISAYATSNPLNNEDISTQLVGISGEMPTSVREYFKINGTFTKILERDTNNRSIVKFSDPMDQRKRNSIPSSETLSIDSVGLEGAYFIKMDYFINYFLNNSENGIVSIINSSINDENKIKNVLYGRTQTQTQTTGPEIVEGRLTDGLELGGFPSYIGYNDHLRSIDSDVMIIYNPIAIDLSRNRETDLRTSVRPGLFTNILRRPTTPTDFEDVILQKFNTAPFSNLESEASGYAELRDGIWINSRAIQSSFLGARTVYEAIESLLQKMNSATENYWDLKIHYDDDLQSFRILDDNLRIPVQSDQKIYVFNKKLSDIEDGVIGPDVLEISVETDYPRIMFAQLAIAGINNLPSLPETGNALVLRNKNLDDLFGPRGTPISDSADSPLNNRQITDLETFIVFRIQNRGGDLNSRRQLVGDLLTTLESNGSIDDNVTQLIKDIYSENNLLSEQQAAAYIAKIENFDLNKRQLQALSEILSLRSISIITKLKSEEILFYETYINSITGAFEIRDAHFRSTIAPVRDAIEKSRESFINIIKRSTSARQLTLGEVLRSQDTVFRTFPSDF